MEQHTLNGHNPYTKVHAFLVLTNTQNDNRMQNQFMDRNFMQNDVMFCISFILNQNIHLWTNFKNVSVTLFWMLFLMQYIEFYIISIKIVWRFVVLSFQIKILLFLIAHYPRSTQLDPKRDLFVGPEVSGCKPPVAP